MKHQNKTILSIKLIQILYAHNLLKIIVPIQTLYFSLAVVATKTCNFFLNKFTNRILKKLEDIVVNRPNLRFHKINTSLCFHSCIC
jgi:hypothetical protein